MNYLGKPTFCPRSVKEWRTWLSDNHLKEEAVWVILYHKKSNEPTITWSQAVDEALCFGWIDSTTNKRDGESYYRYFARRKQKSIWSAINKEKVEKLIRQGKMTEAGLKLIELAKANGSWKVFEEIDDLVVPEDLQAGLDLNLDAKSNWEKFPSSSKKIILYWIKSAKRPETRQKRIAETVSLAAQNIRANHFRQ